MNVFFCISYESLLVAVNEHVFRVFNKCFIVLYVFAILRTRLTREHTRLRNKINKRSARLWQRCKTRDTDHVVISLS